MTLEIEKTESSVRSTTPDNDAVPMSVSSEGQYAASVNLANIFKDHGLIDIEEWRKLVDEAVDTYADYLV